MPQVSEASRVGWLLIAVATAVVASVLGLQRYRQNMLREEGRILSVQIEAGRGLGEANAHLRSSVPAEAAMAQKRSDHAAVLRLRTELQQMKTRAEAMERAQAAVTPMP